MEKENKKHILIVEDSPDLQDLLGQLFKSEGYRVSQSMNGQQALDTLCTMPELPSLILLDLMMPVMDGFAFREKQMQNQKLASIPVIVMTADANPHAKALQLGMENIIKKPINNLDHLLEVASHLSS
jgi:CheY-like chemotaxis protein